MNALNVKLLLVKQIDSAVAMETRLTWAFSCSTEKLQTSHVSGSFSLLAIILRMEDMYKTSLWDAGHTLYMDQNTKHRQNQSNHYEAVPWRKRALLSPYESGR